MKKDKDFDIEDKDLETKKERHIFRKIFFMLILIIVLTVIYARYLGTSGLIVKEYLVKSNNVTEGFKGFKIAHFSDFHYGRTTFIDELKNLVNDINKTKPDLVVFTGDFIDKDVSVTEEEVNSIIEELKRLNSTYGKYYVTGNHDKKFDRYNEMMDTSGFINLDNKNDVIYNKNNETMLITGLNLDGNTKFLEEVFKNKYNYKINIMHYPDLMENIEVYDYDLVLAGHSHNGQIYIPFYGPIIKPNHAKTYYDEYYKVGNTDLYISSGIGTSDFNFRFFNRPSYNLYRLTNK